MDMNEEAKRNYEQSLKIWERLNDVQGIADTHFNIGVLLLENLNLPAEAKVHFHLSAELYGKFDSPQAQVARDAVSSCMQRLTAGDRRSWFRRNLKDSSIASSFGRQQTDSRKPYSPALKEESLAFYWFNSRVISDAGNSMYGRFAYQHLLPWLSPAKQTNPEAWFVLFDGDCMIQPELLRSYFRPQDNVLLDEVRRIGESLCYVIAILGQGTCVQEDIDRELRTVDVLGYMGMTAPAQFNRDTFLHFQEVMALVIAVRIDGAKLKKISYEFHAVNELKQIGFEPFADK
jgi:hypothetical protein